MYTDQIAKHRVPSDGYFDAKDKESVTNLLFYNLRLYLPTKKTKAIIYKSPYDRA